MAAERTAVGYIPAPPGWTLHFPNPTTSACDVVPIAGWTVYDNGDATPYTIDQTGDAACTVADANEGTCFAVAPSGGVS